MQIVYHLGAHATDGDRMLKTLLNNRAALVQRRTEIVTPNRHRGIFEEALMALNGGPATPEMEEIMLDAMLDSDDPQRVVCSSAGFLGPTSRVASAEGLYPGAANRIAALRNLFPSADSEFFIAVRNPATMIAELIQSEQGADYARMTGGTDPDKLSWLPVMQAIAQAAQRRRLVVWCHEDVPLIWPDVVRLVAGLPSDAALSGGLLYMHELLGDQGLARLRQALAARDQMTIASRRQVYAERLAADALPGVLDQTIELPGWSQETVDAVTRRYRAEVGQIAVLPGVEFILP